MGVKTKRTSRSLSSVVATAKRMDKLVEIHAKGAAKLISELAPVSPISEPGYVHMYETVKAVREGHDSWRIVVGKHYAIYVEHGTIYMEAQPFFRPGIAAAQRALKRDLKIVKGPPRIT